MDKKLKLKKDGAIWLMNDIEKSLQDIYNRFRAESMSNEYLRKENKRLEDEHYKDEELHRLSERLKKMEADYYRGFPISEKEDNKISEWVEKQCADGKSEGAIGGRFKYEFLPTGVGTVGTIIDTFTNERFTFRDLC